MKQSKVIGVLLVCLLAAITTGLRAQPLQQQTVTPPGGTDALSAGENQPCENCGPGPHWIDICPGGMDIFPVKTVVGLDTIGDCIVDTNLVFFGSVSVARGAGSPHSLPTELVSMNLTNGALSFIAGAGLGQPPGLPPSPGSIVENGGDPATGDSTFNMFFEIHLGGGLYAYNQVSLQAQANILCVPPNNLYSHMPGCFPLFDSSIPGGNFVANLITLSHQPFPVPMCGEPDAGNCFEANGTPGCNNLDCCEAVCAIDPVCCDVEWDGTCADEALDICGNPVCPGEGNCFEANGTPGCDDPVCCNKVCTIDPFCCDVEWDQECAGEAADICEVLPPCPADLDNSGAVDVKDLLILLGAWGPCPPDGVCPADFDNSGNVDVKDLLFLLGAWGPCL